MKSLLKWLGRILLGLLLLLVLLFVTAGFLPQPADPVIDMATHGAGSSTILPSYTGLQRAFPASNEPAENPSTPAKVELGRLLFFDPLLSSNDELACASCHQPDLGFSDGRATPLGLDGQPLERNAPTLWNVAYVQNLFWDGRETSLESQVNTPLTHPNEMGVADPAALQAELRAIPEYITLFDEAFGGGEAAVTPTNMAYALSAFQRTLLTDNSPFDRYAAGEFEALTSQQRRGLTLFRSGATRCFECHGAPTFASDTFRVVGLPSDDLGRAGVVDDGQQGAFKVPTLRNIALSAPYMHDGSKATLAEVIDFYADGGGRIHGQENIDAFVQGFEMTDQEREDLVAFLHALTDESNLPAIPASVPSGLPVPITAQDNPGRLLAETYNAGGEAAVNEDRPAEEITVAEGESIQAAVDRAQPGDTVLIPYGVYNERVVIDISDLTVHGIPNSAGEYPILDGENNFPEAIIASGNNFTVGYLHVRNYTDNGILVEGVTNVHYHDIFAEKTGAYGIYPVQSTNVLIERIEVTGADDAGIYAGQCEAVIVRDSVAYGNVIGIELENTLGGEIYNNHTYGNTTGIFVVILPQLSSKISRNTLVYNNIADDNNLENFGRAGTTVSLLPPGVGILLLGTDQSEVYDNTMRGNKSTGVAVFSLTSTGQFDVNELDIGSLPEGNWVHNNSYENNGYDPDQFIKDLGIPVGDVLWDGTGSGNRFDESAATTFPPLLPSNNWPTFAQRAYGNILGWLLSLVG